MRRTKKVSRNKYSLHRMIRLGMQMFGFGKKKPKMVLKVEKRDDIKEKKDE
jgi:hypothetical protein